MIACDSPAGGEETLANQADAAAGEAAEAGNDGAGDAAESAGRRPSRKRKSKVIEDASFQAERPQHKDGAAKKTCVTQNAFSD